MSNLFHIYSKPVYREDIQGVRALGALLIMVYHVWLNKVSGGVDVFFVISGFFMANVLLKQLANDGRIRPVVFFGRLIKRIAPAAYTVLLATLLLGLVFIPETQWVGLVDEIIYSAFHVENLHLMSSSVDYLAREEPPSAVQQFWAMSIQVQFYLVLPVVFMFATKASASLRSLAPLAWAAYGVFAASFAYSVYAIEISPASAYFNPATRIWEFFVGVLVALVLPHLRLGASVCAALGWLGFAVLLLAGPVIPRSLNFPGFAALLPVAGAVCLVLAGSGGRLSLVSRVLSHRFLVSLGGVAFTIYLWHWPLLVLYLEYTAAQNVGFVPGILIIFCAVALAYLTNRFVEIPVQAAKSREQNILRAYMLAAAFAIPAVGAAGALKLHFKSLQSAGGTGGAVFQQSSISLQSDATTVSYAQFVSVKSMLPESYLDSCHQNPASPEVKICAYGDTKSDVVVALVGGSHATQWLPALDTIGEQLGLKILNITKSYCPFGAMQSSHPSCVEWNRRVVDYIAQERPATVITNSTRAHKGDVEEHVPDQWQALGRQGIEVIGIRDNPQFEWDAVHCVVRNKTDPLRCSKALNQSLLLEDPAKRVLTQTPNLRLVDMTNYLCADNTCTVVFNDIIMYSDKEHVSAPYVNFLTGKLLEQLQNVSPATFASGRELGSKVEQGPAMFGCG